MNLLTNKFQRVDARTIVKLYVAQGFLKVEKPGENQIFGGDGQEFYFDF